MLDALPATTLPIYPGLTHASNWKIKVRSFIGNHISTTPENLAKIRPVNTEMDSLSGKNK